MKPNVHIVIPIHNRINATKECLQSLNAQTYRSFKVIVVDDGSADGSSEYINEHHQEVTILQGNGELWWSGATNLGIEHVLKRCHADDYILTLNNDTTLPATYLETMVSLAQKAPKALIGSIAFDSRHKEFAVDEGVDVNWITAKFRRLKRPSVDGTSGFYAVSVLPGRGTLIPVRAFREVGLYDAKHFPQYAADYDFSLRASKAGYQLLLHPASFLYSRTELSGISNAHMHVSLAACVRSFGSIRSPNNLKVRIRFALRHAPILYWPSFVLCDLARVIFGTARNQIRNQLRHYKDAKLRSARIR